jgi:hypothetical protein
VVPQCFGDEQLRQIASLSSVFEIGVGVNLGLALIDSFRLHLESLLRTVIEKYKGDAAERLLPLFEEFPGSAQSAESEGSESQPSAIAWIRNYVSIGDSLKHLFLSPALAALAKSMALILAVLFALALSVAPFSERCLSMAESIGVLLLAIFPIVFAAALSLIASVILLGLFIWGKVMLWHSGMAVDTVKRIQKRNRELASRKIDVKSPE